jgi:hypothetical protein
MSRSVKEIIYHTKSSAVLGLNLPAMLDRRVDT